MDECNGFNFSFKDYLHIVDGIREESKLLLKESVHELFSSYNLSVSSSPAIVSTEVPALMTELQFCRDCFSQQVDLMHFVEQCEKDVSEELEVYALVTLILKFYEKCRMGQRESEAVIAKQLGFSIKEVIVLRESFACMTTTGQIGLPEVKRWFKEINPSMDVDAKACEIEALMEEVSPVAFTQPAHKTEQAESGLPGADSPEDGVQEEDGQAKKGRSQTARQTIVRFDGDAINTPAAVPDASPNAPPRRERHHVEILGLDDDDPQNVDSNLPSCQEEEEETEELPTEEAVDEESPKFAEPEVKPAPAPPPPPPQETHILFFDGYMRLMSMLMKG
jgi:hypothetical protein